MNYELKSTFEHYFPQGSHGGQCAVFAEGLVVIGLVGDTLETKKGAVINRGILSENLNGDFRVGDALIIDTGTQTGHVAVINSIVGGQLCLTESNYHLDEKVDHTRQISPKIGQIIGVLRGNLKIKVINPMFTAKIKVVANNANWPSMQAKIAEIKQRVLAASQNRIDCQIDVIETAFENVVYKNEIADPTLGLPSGANLVDQDWYDANIAPIGKGYDFVCFLLTGEPILNLKGNTINKFPNPIQITMFANENEVAGETDTLQMNDFVNILIHEVFGHGLRYITGQEDLHADGTFLVHEYLQTIYEPPQYHIRFDLVDLLNLLDYSKLKHAGVPLDPMVYDVYLPDQGIGFTTAQFETFSPEVQAAILFNNIGGKNTFLNGQIDQRDPNFIYP